MMTSILHKLWFIYSCSNRPPLVINKSTSGIKHTVSLTAVGSFFLPESVRTGALEEKVLQISPSRIRVGCCWTLRFKPSGDRRPHVKVGVWKLCKNGISFYDTVRAMSWVVSYRNGSDLKWFLNPVSKNIENFPRTSIEAVRVAFLIS